MHAHSAQNYNIRMQNYYKKINNSNNYNYNQKNKEIKLHKTIN